MSPPYVEPKRQHISTCKHEGHPASECPQNKGQAEMKCQQTSGSSSCKHEGHEAKDCPQRGRVAPKLQSAAAEPPCRHVGHEAHACPQQISRDAMNRQQTATEQPAVVSGPQHMLNIYKASTQASKDASGGCPEFRDRESFANVYTYVVSLTSF